YRDRVIAAVLLAFLGTALLGWLVLRHGLRPLRTLAATSRRVSRLVGWISAAFAASVRSGRRPWRRTSQP
ncbi:hypothetical protein ACV348_32870, partial [Pseudomonas aeruginosa]